MTTEHIRRLAAVWFADVSGYTALSARDEDAALAVIEELQLLSGAIVKKHRGRIVKFIGDAVMAAFESAEGSIRAALELQAAFRGSEMVRLHGTALTIGVHVGEVAEAPDGDVYGDGVNVAARIQGIAKAGMVVTSDAVARLLENRSEFTLRSVGSHELKGVRRPVEVFAITVATEEDLRRTQPGSAAVAMTTELCTAALSGSYAISRELGAGGMATVYLADDLKHHRKVAVKVLRPELSALIGAERFLAEIRTTANLQHPNILPLFDSGQVDQFLYYVMPFVEGESLKDRLDRDRQLPVDEAIRIAIEVADALGAAHAAGVVHRDIKPANILLSGGHAMVADFGIALAREEESIRLTQAGVSVGSPLYMSPEQASGDGAVDARTDVYALGCVLYEMLTGEPPFMGATFQSLLSKKLAHAPVPIRTLRDAVPESVEAVVQRAIRPLAADRFAGAADMAKELRTSATPVAAPVAPAARPLGAILVRALISVVAVMAAVLVLAADVSESPAELSGLVATRVGMVVASHLVSGAATTGPGEARAPVTATIPAREVLLDRVEGVYVPPAVRADGSAYAGGNYTTSILLIAPAEGGSVQVDPVTLPVGSEFIARIAEGADGFEILLDQAAGDVHVSVRGPVQIFVDGGVDDLLDFGPAGGRISVGAGEDGFQLGVVPAGDGVGCDDCATIALNLPVSGLELSTVEEAVGLEASMAQRVSTVYGGVLSVPGVERDLQPGEVVRFDSFSGTVGRIDVGRDSLRLDAAAASVTGLRSSTRGDLMPSRFSTLGTGQRIVWTAGLSVFVLLLLLVAPRAWKSTH